MDTLAELERETVKPQISVITAVYNSQDTIAQCIRSVQEQTHLDWEMLITDDCSSDKTTEVVEEFCKADARIKLFRLTSNSGSGVARNHSIQQATGRFIAFLDADDLWLPEKLRRQSEFMLANNYDLTYSAYQKIDPEGHKLGIIWPPMTVNYKSLLRSNSIGCLTAMYSADKLGKRYMPTIRKRQDYGLWLNILKDVKQAHCLPEVLALYRVGRSSLSSNKFKVLGFQWTFYRQVLNFSIVKSTWYFLSYAIAGTFKHFK